MFGELTEELLELTASVQGASPSRFAFVIDCCSCSCCSCLFNCR